MKSILFETEDHTLELFESESIARHTGRRFIVEFNGEIMSFKTLNGAKNKFNKLKEKLTHEN